MNRELKLEEKYFRSDSTFFRSNSKNFQNNSDLDLKNISDQFPRFLIFSLIRLLSDEIPFRSKGSKISFPNRIKIYFFLTITYFRNRV